MNMFGLLLAQAESPIKEGGVFGMTWGQILEYGGTVLWIILGVSVIALACVFWLLIVLRKGASVPKAHVAEVLECLKEGKLQEARTLCEERPCAYTAMARKAIEFLSSTPYADPVLLKEVVQGEGQVQAARILGRPGLLMHVVTIAPMLGLLGTVLGMLASFISIAGDVAAAKPVLLAQGMAKAIITTVAGLIVAIAASVFHAVFTYRAERIAYALSASADELLTVLLSLQHKR